jgi:predicted PurR-regulated permease PerM
MPAKPISLPGNSTRIDDLMSQPARISCVIVALLLVLVAYLHLGTFLLTSLFGYLALRAFTIRRSKWLSVTLYLIAVAVISAGLLYFSNLAYRTLPRVAETSIPAMVGFAEKNGIDLPFTDYASLKSTALDAAREGFAIVSQYARTASWQLVLLLAGLVVPLSIFMGPGWTARKEEPTESGNLYFAVTREISMRFKTLYESFAKVIGAQIVISAVNAAMTAIFLIVNSYPYAGLLTTLVFLCGLIPIVGNLISNAVIVGVGFTLSSRIGIYALVFLVVIHKLEYFLNSKIVGQRIDSPMWLTLIGLLVGERVMGIPGMILAPVVLHFIRVETSACHPKPGDRMLPSLSDR